MAKILFFLLLFPLCCLGEKINSSEFNSIFEKLNFSKNDDRFASLLLSFFQNLEKGIYDKKVVLILKTMAEKSDAFGDQKNVIKLSLELPCKELLINPSEPNNNLSNLWVNYLKKYCRLNLLEDISKGKFDKENEELFYRSLSKFLEGESNKLFVNFVSTMNQQEGIGQKILDLIAKSILFSKIVPSNEVIQQLKLNKDLTAFFQSENLFAKNQEYIFLKEFKNIINSVLSQASYNLLASNNPAVSFLKNNQEFISSDGIYKSLKIIGYEQLRVKNKDKAREVYRMCEEFSPPNKKLESQFFLIWPSIFTKNYPEAVRIIKQTNMMDNFEDYPSMVQFWMAYSLQKNNDLILAKSLYEKLIKQNLFDYYSILAIKSLKSLNQNFDPMKAIEQTTLSFNHFYLKTEDLKDAFNSSIIRAFLWLEQGREDYYKMEIDNLLSTDVKSALKTQSQIPDKEFKSWLILNFLGLLNQKGFYLNTFKLAFDSIDKNYINFSLPTLKTLFPMSYFSKIKEIESGVDPIITLSLIRQESAFNPRARSIAGATGLMQIMPKTAQTLNSKIKRNQLNNPDINLTLGILYLERLLKKYEGDLVYALSAYNAGEKRLSSWLKDYFFNQDPVVMVESIPFEETRNYVKLIYRNIFFYKYLSNDPTVFLPVQDSFKVDIYN